MWGLQALLLFLKLVSGKDGVFSPALFSIIPMEFKDYPSETGWFMVAQKTNFVSSFSGVSWWLVFIPSYLIVIRFLLILFTKQEKEI